MTTGKVTKSEARKKGGSGAPIKEGRCVLVAGGQEVRMVAVVRGNLAQSKQCVACYLVIGLAQPLRHQVQEQGERLRCLGFVRDKKAGLSTVQRQR